MKKIQLIFPGDDLGVEKGIKLKDMFPRDFACLGLIYLASQVDRDYWEVEIFNERYTPEEKILSRMDGDIVGVSSLFNMHRKALGYLQVAKKKGAITIIGGPSATNLGVKTLINNVFVDYVFCGDAEESFIQFLDYYRHRNPRLNQILGLCYREANKIRTNPIPKGIELDSLPLIDLEDLVDKDIFINSYFQKKEGIRISYMTTSAVRGCQKAMEKGRCKFCSASVKGLRFTSPKKFYAQIRILQEKYNITNFLETGDDIVIPKYLDALVAGKPKDLEYNLFVQASLERITPEIASKMKQIGTSVAFLGVESFHPRIMANINKLRRNILEQIKCLITEGIVARLSVIYGLPEEDEGTIDYTNEKLEGLVEGCPEGSIIIRPRVTFPWPGSALFRDCLRDEKLVGEYNRKTGQDLRTEDKIDHLLLRELYVKYFTSLSIDVIEDKIRECQRSLPMEVRPLYV